MEVENVDDGTGKHKIKCNIYTGQINVNAITPTSAAEGSKYAQ